MQSFSKILVLSLGLTQTVNLDEIAKKIIAESESRLLDATTEIIKGNQVHIIKVLTVKGHIQYIKIDVDSGELVK